MRLAYKNRFVLNGTFISFNVFMEKIVKKILTHVHIQFKKESAVNKRYSDLFWPKDITRSYLFTWLNRMPCARMDEKSLKLDSDWLRPCPGSACCLSRSWPSAEPWPRPHKPTRNTVHYFG